MEKFDLIDLNDIDKYIVSRFNIGLSYILMVLITGIAYILLFASVINIGYLIFLPLNMVTSYVIVSLCISIISYFIVKKLLDYSTDLFLENVNRLMISERYHQIIDEMTKIMEEQSEDNLPF